MRCIIRPLLFFQSIFYLIIGEPFHLMFQHPVSRAQDNLCVFWRQDESNDAMFTLGLGLLTWSTIYGLENFDVWDGSELSCVAVANIAAGTLSLSADIWQCLRCQVITSWCLPVHVANYPRQMGVMRC